MAIYYGRAKQRTGSVNRKQPGLKLSGCVSKVGRTAFCRISISQRVKCGLPTIGLPKSRAAAGGVGRIWTPRL